MRAILPGAEGPHLQDIAEPVARPAEVLVRVHASALNRADLFMRKGAPHGRVGGAGSAMGLEWAGEVIDRGAAVNQWRVGDRVMAAGGSAFAEFAVGHQDRIYPIPDGMSYQNAATLPVALQTMNDAIATHGELRAGQSVLIQGASSGVGLMAMQIAKYLGAKLVIGTSTNTERREHLAAFGADVAVNSADPDWVGQILQATDDAGVDLIVDQVAGPLMNGNLAATRIGGRIVNVGRLGGMHGSLDFDLHALRRIHYVGVTFRTRSSAEVEEIVRRTRADLEPALTQGALRLPIDRVYPLAEAAAALERMAGNAHFGKIVLSNTD